LPPVNRFNSKKDWAFASDVWRDSSFAVVNLKSAVRTTDPDFLRVLNKVRVGTFDIEVKDFFKDRRALLDDTFEGTKIFPHRQSAEDYNLRRLNDIRGDLHSFYTQYI